MRQSGPDSDRQARGRMPPPSWCGARGAGVQYGVRPFPGLAVSHKCRLSLLQTREGCCQRRDKNVECRRTGHFRAVRVVNGTGQRAPHRRQKARRDPPSAAAQVQYIRDRIYTT